MPNTTTPLPTVKGWWLDQVNGRLYAVYGGVKNFYLTATGLVGSFALSVTGGITALTGDITATVGHLVATAGDAKVLAGNLRLGVISAFATTEPTSAVVMKVGTNPVGAITTSGAIFCTTGGATLSKIIANGTVTQIEA